MGISAAWGLLATVAVLVGCVRGGAVMMRRLVKFLARVVRCGRTLATDRTIPRWVRALLVFGCLPIPFLLDEAALVLAVGILAVFYRSTLTQAWKVTKR